MGRRSMVSVVPTPRGAQERRALSNAYQRMLRDSVVDKARIRAQSYEEDCIDVLFGMATDVSGEVPHALRRQCALDVLVQARGPIAPQIHDGATVDPRAPATDGGAGTVADQIDAARRSATILAEVQDYVQQGIAFDRWPQALRDAVGPDMGAAFGEESTG